MTALLRGLCGACALGVALGCVNIAPPQRGGPPLRISTLADEGDRVRRASQRLVLSGLDAELDGQPRAALPRYERALQMDGTNPYAYLALARYHDEIGNPERTLRYVQQAELLLESQGVLSARAEAHVLGLRGSALRAMGREPAASQLLERARDLEPRVWDDGQLSASELY